MPADPPGDRNTAATHVGHLRFGPVGQRSPETKPTPPPPPPPPTPAPSRTPAPTPAPAPAPLRGVSAPSPEVLDNLEHTWLEMLERETAKMPSLADAFHAGRTASPAEIGAVVEHAQQIETWYTNFLPVARQLAKHDRTRLLDRVNAYIDDMRETIAIYRTMQQDARTADRALHTIMTASNEDTRARLGAMHDAAKRRSTMRTRSGGSRSRAEDARNPATHCTQQRFIRCRSIAHLQTINCDLIIISKL